MRKAFATTPVAEIVAHSGDGFVDKGAEASAMAKRLIVCCDGTWNTLNQAVCGDPCPTNVSQMAGRSRISTGRNATTLLLRGGSASTGGSDSGAPWPSTRGAARSGPPRGPATHGPTSTSNRCGPPACAATSAVAIPTLRWMRARCCGWPTGRVSADSSSKRMPSQRRLRMPPRRHKTGWPDVDPNPLGTLRQSRTAFYRLLPRLIRRPGAKDPDHEYVADTAVDRHHRDRRYAPAGLIEYLDAGGPVIPVAPARHRATPALLPRRRKRDRVDKPALVQSETTMGRMR